MKPVLKFNIRNQKISRVDNFLPVRYSKNYLYAEFDFKTEDWTLVAKTAIFTSQNHTIHVVLGATDTCLVPPEVLTDTWFTVSVFGGDLITVTTEKIKLYESGYRPDGVPEPTPDVYTQLLNMVSSKADGLSYSDNILSLLSGDKTIATVTITSASDEGGDSTAREIELRNNGTYIQWKYTDETLWRDLVSLEEISGKDAYKYAQEAGYTKSEEQFAIDLAKGSGATEEQAKQIKQNKNDISSLSEAIENQQKEIDELKESGTGGSGVVVSGVEPATDDIPKVFFDEAIPQTKTDTKTKFRYISKTLDFDGYAEFKAQGNSSMSYPKKNMTVKMSKDETLEEKLKVNFKNWGEQRKHVYKANWIDLSHSRNVVSARLWADVVKSRSDYLSLPELLRTSPNQGAVDGFPVKVYSQGIYQGRYTLNIPKDAWMANMDDELDNHCILCGENYVSGCFRATANINGGDWTDEIHDTVPSSIKTRWNEVISFVMDSTDEEFKANLGNYFFVDSLIDYFIFGMVSCGLDAFGKNQIYMTYDGIRWIASMYDMDSTWGLYWDGSKFVSASYTREQFEDLISGRQGNLLYIRLVELFAAQIKERYAELKQGALSVPNIINRFERFTDIASLDLVEEDYASTTGGGAFTNIPSKSTNNIQQIRQFVVDRYVYCDEYFASLGEIEPDNPDNPEVTLSSISATYTGGNVTVGTSINDLTGITVTATYSDGSTANVTGYTLSGTIVEGSNTITVSYNGLTTTFIVVGFVEVVEPMLLYSLPEETVFNAEQETYIDTGVQLLNEPKDFTLFLEWSGSSSNVLQGNTHVVFHAMNEASPYPGLCFQITKGGHYTVNYYTSKQENLTLYNDTEKHKMVITRQADSTAITLNFDGTEYILNGTNTPVEQTLLLGCYQAADGTKGRFWNGTIHDCKIWNYALSDEEITTLMS